MIVRPYTEQAEEACYRELQLPAGKLHVYASEEIFRSLDYRVFAMANNNLQIPGLTYMSYTPDVHVGEGTCIGTTAVWNTDGGYVSPSIVGSDIGCGMRLHLTNMHRDELRDIRLRRKLVRAIDHYLPAEEHARGHYSDIRLEHVLIKGLRGLPNKYVPDHYTPKQSTSLTHVECARYRFDEGVLDRFPDRVWHRAHRQLGTLGGGNHFAELQAVEIDERSRELAERWGLFDGQVVVMIHSGSRAWGGAVSRYGTTELLKVMRRLGLGTADPKLVYAPLSDPSAQAYVQLLYSALNYAVASRHLIAYAIRQACREVLGTAFEMRTLYDLMHNYAWEEQHDGSSRFIHRKGATRALPAQHPDNPSPYLETGHPALIPGSMGTSSYIMVGQPGGRDNYYSICHGAGRIRSRSATKKLVSVRDFAAALGVGTEDEVVVNHRSLDALVDESPQAYKDVDQIIDSVAGAGLAVPVAACRPLATIKGVSS
ncbi:RtcB family protein [Paenibacillus puerhi]|uniref:RtcB family protein n=1 Tax=Paenibacillus puerhi TaxID=2692622 RepID=UPI00135939DC|nr:RtcB family protein [Paenibacillus puerhi]